MSRQESGTERDAAMHRNGFEEPGLEQPKQSPPPTPQAYVDGFVMFFDLEIHVDPRVMVPREETKLLVDEAMLLPKGSRVHEVGTGSGAVAIAIKAIRDDLRVTASDISADAVLVAKENAEHLNVALIATECAGLPPGIKEAGCDLVVANLPYLTEESIRERPSWVEGEPHLATVGGSGEDGLGEIVRLVEECPSGFRVALEHDTHQGEAVRSMLKDATTKNDQHGRERMTVGLVP